MQLCRFYATRGHVRPKTVTGTVKLAIGMHVFPLISRRCHGSKISSINSLVVRKTLLLNLSPTFPIYNLRVKKQGLMSVADHGCQIVHGLLEDVSIDDRIRFVETQQSSPSRNVVRRKRSTNLNKKDQGVIIWSKDSRAGIEKRQRVSRRFYKVLRRPPPIALARYLNQKSPDARAAIWAELHKHGDILGSDLPVTLLRYMHESQHQDAQGSSKPFFPDLQASGYSMEDLKLWASIMQASDGDAMAEKYLHSSSIHGQPTFLLLEILRRTDLSAKVVRLLIVHSWDRLLGKVSQSLPLSTDILLQKEILLRAQPPNLEVEPLDVYRGAPFEETTFMTLVCRLLRHARQSWPAAVLSISSMVPVYVSQLSHESEHPNGLLEGRLHRRVCLIYNTIIRRLSLPSTTNPMRNMNHNWKAQRSLLASANQYRPPVIIDQSSYRAVTRVMIALAKNKEEKTYSRLQQGSWPPWRKELDGMDVQRSPEEDFSRGARAIQKMEEAGYSQDIADRSRGLMAGRDADGTPAVQTRDLVRPIGSARESRLDITYEWAARIKTTRDVQEAWAAFVGLPRGTFPSLQMYHAMFEKLTYDQARSGRFHNHDALPGDGKEVRPVEDGNITPDEKLRTKAPSTEQLYERMIYQGVRPTGRCLSFLVTHALNIETGVQYLQDSLMHPTVLQILLGWVPLNNTRQQKRLRQVPDVILLAFIKLLCRQTYRIPILSEEDTTDSVELADPTAKYRMRRMSSALAPSARFNPLLHALELIKSYGTSKRPIWFALFTALARRDVMVSRELLNSPENDVLAWQVLEAALNDASKAGVKLDPQGFQIICTGYEKALLASHQLPRNQDVSRMLETSAQNLKTGFATLTQHRENENHLDGYQLPRQLYTIEGSMIHAYVRVLGLLRNMDDVVTVARWMVDNQTDLDNVASSTKNGKKLLKRCLTAMRFFLKEANASSSASAELRSLLEELQIWDGWPSDDAVDRYSSYIHNMK